jgi:hypothetical protein
MGPAWFNQNGWELGAPSQSLVPGQNQYPKLAIHAHPDGLAVNARLTSRLNTGFAAKQVSVQAPSVTATVALTIPAGQPVLVTASFSPKAENGTGLLTRQARFPAKPRQERPADRR